MPLNRRDRELVERFLEMTKDVSPEVAAERAGLNGLTIRRWRQALPSRIETETRLKVIGYLEFEDEESRMVREDSARRGTAARMVREMEATYGGDSPEKQLVDMLGLPDALRRMAGHVPPSDLVAAAMQLAIDDNWSEERRERLARLCFEMLENAKKSGR